MATTGKKEYTLQINGIDTAIKDSTSLLEVLRALDSEIEKGASVTSTAAKSSQNRKTALSEEEKAAKKLEETQRKIKAAQEGTTDAQVKANQALREATREQKLRIELEQAAVGSVKAMRAELSILKNEWAGMGEEADPKKLKALSEEIRVLNDRIKEAEQSTGDFRRNVGNYESALDGVKNLGKGIDDVTKAGLGFTQSLMASTQLLGLFGTETEESAETTRNLQKALALLSLAQQVNSNLLKEGTLLKVKDAAAEKLRAVQTAIATAATKASSAALGLFKKALIATGIGAVVVALGTLVANFDKVKKVVLNLLPGLKDTGAAFDEIKAVLRGVGEAVVNWVLTPFRTAMAFIQKFVKGDFKGAITAGLDEIKQGYNVAANYQKGYEEQSLRNAKRAQVEQAKLRASELDNLIKDNEARYGFDWKYTEEARQAYLDLFAAKKLMYEGDAEALRDLQREEWRYLWELKQRRKETSASGGTAEQRAAAELKALREAEDARVKLIEDGTERTRKTVELSYSRQIEDLRLRLKTETDLTVAAREALNDKILSLETQRAADLQKLEQEQAERMRVLERELEDSRTSLIENSYDRRMTEINLQYDRQIESYKKYLDEEGGLTEKQRKRIDELILNAQKARGVALNRLLGEQLEKRAGLQLSAVDNTLKGIEDKIENAVARKKNGSGLIDVEGTRENLAEVDSALDEYILGLNKYLDAAKMAYDAVSSTLQGRELEAEQQKYARTVENVTERINAAYALQAESAERSKGIQLEALAELFEKMSEYADAAAQVMASVAETWNMGLQAQVDDLNAQLDALEERYEKAQKQREDAVAHVEEIESRLQAATGGTTEALKAQLQEAMHARADAEREEQRLAKEKERLEAQAAWKEKQMRRSELMSQIAQGIANTAEGATTALRWGPILGPILAAMVTALGLAQVGIMTRQLTKLADGGEIVGPSHADGGVPIPGTNYEVEGGEFVVNQRSYRANADLVRFINDTPRTITAADLMGVVPRGDTPVINVDAGRGGEDRIIEAIEGIDFRPVVSVTDINDVNKEMVTVKDLAGF